MTRNRMTAVSTAGYKTLNIRKFIISHVSVSRHETTDRKTEVKSDREKERKKYVGVKERQKIILSR